MLDATPSQSDAAWSLYIRLKYGSAVWKALFG